MPPVPSSDSDKEDPNGGGYNPSQFDTQKKSNKSGS